MTSVRVGVRELRNQTAAWIRRAGDGERVIVTVDCDPHNPTRGAVQFAVRDTGIGIPDDSRELIFAPSTKLDSVHKSC